MSVVLDTNILTRASQPAHPSHNQTLDALAVLQKQGEDLCIVPQNLYEFAVYHAGRSVEPLNGVSKGGEHPLWSRAGLRPRPRSGFVYFESLPLGPWRRMV